MSDGEEEQGRWKGGKKRMREKVGKDDRRIGDKRKHERGSGGACRSKAGESGERSYREAQRGCNTG